jgi:hypothetical protein
MKAFFTFFLLTLILQNSNAQKRIVEFSGGYTGFDSWGVNGFNLNVSYKQKIIKRLNAYFQFNQSSGMKETKLTNGYEDYPFAYFYASNSVKKLNLGTSISLIDKSHHTVCVDILGSLIHYKMLYTGGYIRNLDTNAPKELRFFGLPLNYEKNVTLGMMGQIGYRYKFKKHLGVGIDCNIQLYEGNSEGNLNLVIQHRF